MNVLDHDLLAGGARELAAQAVDADGLADVAAEVDAGGGGGVRDDVVLLVDQGEAGLAFLGVFQGDQTAAGVEAVVDFSDPVCLAGRGRRPGGEKPDGAYA